MDATLARLIIDETAIPQRDSIPKKLTKFVVQLLGDGGGKKIFEKFSPEIREQNYLNVYNSRMRQIEDIIGLARGSLSEVEILAKTATEVGVSKQETYALIVDNQKALENAIRQLVYSMAVWTEPTQVIKQEDIEMTFDFDDGVVSNPKEQIATMLQLQSAGNIPAYRVVMSYFNIDMEEAKEMVAEAKQETWDKMQTETDDNAEAEFE